MNPKLQVLDILCVFSYSWVYAHYVTLDITERTDDQRSGIFTTIIITGVEEWVEFLIEGTASKGVDKSSSIDIIEGDQTLPIIHKHTHFLRLWLQRERDTRFSKSFVPQRYRPKTIMRVQCDLSLSVDWLSNHS